MMFPPGGRPTLAHLRAFMLIILITTMSSDSDGSEILDFVPQDREQHPTYFGEVEPILRRKCRECHRPGQVAPFSLMTYEQARKRAGNLATVVEERRMPPWKPVPGFGPKLKHDRSLSSLEIKTLRAWADSGAVRGHENNQPVTTSFASEWLLGKPDLVLEPSESFTVPASGPDVHRCFVIPTNLPNDVYVSAVEYCPGNARVVHHLMAFVETLGAGRRRDEAEPGPGYSSYSGAGVEIFGDLGGWAPGNEPSRLPDGVGRSLPKGADVILQVHYHPDGKLEVDRTRIGLYLSRTPVRQTLQWKGVTSHDIRLEAGEADTKVKASWTVPVDIEALAIAPHMHQLGRSMAMTATYPGGRIADLIRIDDWDPGWQGTYSFVDVLPLPKGTIIRVVAHYDNSAHDRNPHQPPRLVKWGQGSSDEMCVGYIAVVKARQDLTRPGEKDDLFPILLNQFRKQDRREREESRRPRGPFGSEFISDPRAMAPGSSS